MEKLQILGVKVDNLSLQEAVEKIKKFLETKNKHFVVTPNPEFIVTAQHDRPFRDILNFADIAIADGVGLQYAARLQGQRLQRVTGVDLMWFICELAAQQGSSIFLLGAADGVAEQTAQFLQSHFADLKVVGTESRGVISDNGKASSDPELIKKITAAGPKILFVAFGHGKQEKWIFHHLDHLPSVRLAVGIGGAFDYLSGNITRAPWPLRNLGLEWLYRLIKEPWRKDRIITAVIIFPWLVIKNEVLKKLSRILNRNIS